VAPPIIGGSLIRQLTRWPMKRILRSLSVAALPFGAALGQTAPQPVVVPVMQKDLADLPGREMVMLSVEYPPGTVEHIHRHDAYAFVYVLEGTIVEQVTGGKEVTLTPGQTFYEGPNDVHTVGRNASTTKSAKFVVVMVKKKGVDAVLPAE
jgi:quercetin dioxygenase-like cupin family protein